MNLVPFFQSSIAIQLHVYAAIIAVILGSYVLWARKGSFSHKITGRIWGLAMITVSLSSFAIHEIRMIGLFSPIHLLSVLVLISLGTAVYAARNRQIARHQNAMKWLYFAGLIVPGIFTLLPDRLLFQVVIEPILRVFSLDGLMAERVDPVAAAFGGFIVISLGLFLLRVLRRQ